MAIVRDLSGNSPAGSLAGQKDAHLSRKDRVHRSYAVTCSDTVDIPQGVTEALMVATAGDYTVIYGNDVQGTVNLAAGIWHPMNVKRVFSTGAASTTGVEAGY